MTARKNLSVRETAQRLGCTLKYVFDLLYADKLEGAHKAGERWVIPSSAVERWRGRRNVKAHHARPQRHSALVAGLLLLLTLIIPGVARGQTTTIVSATGIFDKNGNPYTGTITPIQVVATGQPQIFYSPVALNGVGAFSTSVQSGVSYLFTACSVPIQLGPLANPTPRQVCFTTPTPILVSGASLDITAQLQAAASVSPILGPQIGSITSIGLSMPAEFNVSGSPVTGSSGTLTVTKANQSANTVYAGPASGGAAAPGFRAHVPADFPAGSNCGANNFANGIGAVLAPNCAQPSFSNLSGSIAVGQTPLTTLGDLLYVNSTPALARLAGNTGTAKNFLTQTGTGTASAAPSWNTIAGADVPAINLGATGNGGITGNLPVADLVAGSNGQCVNTSGTTVVWGSCAGTAGVQTVFAGAGGIANASTTAVQNVTSFSPGFAAGALNTLGKTIRITNTGSFSFLNTSQFLSFGLAVQGSTAPLVTTQGSVVNGGGYTIIWLCQVTTTGSSGFMQCGATGGVSNNSNQNQSLANIAKVTISVNLTTAISIVTTAQFPTTASTSNVVNEAWMTVEQLN